MAAQKQKWYVVWAGRKPGVYTSWEDTLAQVKGAAGAVYKAFDTREAAYAAFEQEAACHVRGAAARAAGSGGKVVGDAAPRVRSTPAVAVGGSRRQPLVNPPSYRTDTILPLHRDVAARAWAVDAACSGNPGQMEYRGVCLQTGVEVFHLGPVLGTNNIGEFLAIVHAFALIAQMAPDQRPALIYSDSRNAIGWVARGKCNTTLMHTSNTAAVHDLIERAERWLSANTFRLPVKKWQTRQWGEIPADFGRKS
ncbi:MAG: ribonuclease H family protein [Bacteroidales bacterium]|nr:ribonuclease H family protein [Bacteroidales bacterium]